MTANTMPTCPVQQKCGACQYLDIPYGDQLALKQTAMNDLFRPFATDTTVFSPIAGMEEPFYYRNKVTSPFVPGKRLSSNAQNKGGNKAGKRTKNHSKNKQGKAAVRHEILCGMYAQGTHTVIPTDECLLENQTAKRIILAIKSIMQRYDMEPYNEDTGTGFVRHAIVRVGHASGEILVTLVTNDSFFPGSRNFCRELVKRIPEITTIVQNVNTRQTNVILGQHEKTLYGPGFILDELCGLSFRISSGSFYQVNSTQTEVLYRLAITMANLTGTETVLDAYCGTGTIGLVAAKGLPETPRAHAAEVIGVDNVTSATKDAQQNAVHNGITNARFITNDAGNFMKDCAAAGEHLDVLLMDPPRAGASEAFLEATCTLKPKRIVYISCNPITQKRDVAYLTKTGYTLYRVQPVDMFPHTEHVENICMLELSHI
ncbi:MAG: 23S rRNA (uracil(1939)-C(5))-methyltransferase RlmD [Eggerthellaceae bacterium]